MKSIHFAAACAVLALGAPCLASAQSSASPPPPIPVPPVPTSQSPRDTLEANMKTRMTSASATLGSAVEELKGGDKVKGCADLRSGSDDLAAVSEMLGQDLELIKVDPSLSQASRDDLITKGQDALAKLTAARSAVGNLLQQQCTS